MDHTTHNKIESFIWSTADDCLRDVFVRSKYLDVILPRFVLRRLDCLLEPSKGTVLEEARFQREQADTPDLDPHGLRQYWSEVDLYKRYAYDPDFKRAIDATVARLLVMRGTNEGQRPGMGGGR